MQATMMQSFAFCCCAALCIFSSFFQPIGERERGRWSFSRLRFLIAGNSEDSEGNRAVIKNLAALSGRVRWGHGRWLLYFVVVGKKLWCRMGDDDLGKSHAKPRVSCGQRMLYMEVRD
jgi:hypothetical protein